jgi:hypothetical protein
MYFKHCPKCNEKQIYKSDECLRHAIERNTTCSHCIASARVFSNETKKKLSIAGMGHIGYNKGMPSPFKGCKHTTKSNEKNRLAHLGVKHNEEFKRKCRINVLNRMEKLGIPPCDDKGSAEYFQYQNESGFNFITNYKLKDLGYIVDAYDPIQHIVCEYDTPYHNRLGQKRKDAKRQSDIIDYFKQIGSPLSSFVRINSLTEKKEVFK